MLESRLLLRRLNLSGSPVSPFDPIRFAWRTLFLPADSLVFSPGYNSPLFCRLQFIFIVHDLNHIDRLENTSFLKRAYYRFVLRRACKFAQIVFTVSEFSRKRIIEWAEVSEDKVINISNGVDDIFTPFGELFSPGYPYLLCVSNRKQHKNEIRLIQAFSAASIDNSIHLIFTGKPNEELIELIKTLDLCAKIGFTGNISDEDLPKLYRGALALVFPSLYEGFGLPVIEAMASGTPVLTSNTSALPEVAGDISVLVDPTSVSAIAGGIQSLCNDSILRQELRDRGLVWAQKFSWDVVASRVKEAIEALPAKN